MQEKRGAWRVERAELCPNTSERKQVGQIAGVDQWPADVRDGVTRRGVAPVVVACRRSREPAGRTGRGLSEHQREKAGRPDCRCGSAAGGRSGWRDPAASRARPPRCSLSRQARLVTNCWSAGRAEGNANMISSRDWSRKLQLQPFSLFIAPPFEARSVGVGDSGRPDTSMISASACEEPSKR
jgi:hypothetical protein